MEILIAATVLGAALILIVGALLIYGIKKNPVKKGSWQETAWWVGLFAPFIFKDKDDE
jgi:hypothetical protein